MTDRCSIAAARRDLPALVREAEAGGTVELTRRGKAVAIIVGCRRFKRLVPSRRGFIEAYGEFLRDTDLAELAFDPDDLFAGARDSAPGREVCM